MTQKWPATGYTMSGKELEALCNAFGKPLKTFCGLLGLRASQINWVRKSPKMDFTEDSFARSYIDQMRTRLQETSK